MNTTRKVIRADVDAVRELVGKLADLETCTKPHDTDDLDLNRVGRGYLEMAIRAERIASLFKARGTALLGI